MTRNEQQLYSDVTSIKESLKKIANTLEKGKAVTHADVHNAKYNNDIPGFEGTLDALDVLCDIKTITDDYASNKELQELSDRDVFDDHVHNDYLNDLVTDMTKEQYVKFFLDMDFGFALSDTSAFKQHCYVLEYEECLDAIKSALHITGDEDYVKNYSGNEERVTNYVKDVLEHRSQDVTPTSDNPDPAGYGHYKHEFNPYCDGIKDDSDHDIRTTAQFYEIEYIAKHGATKKECILDYVTNEFGITGARYTDIIKFAYYLGEHNKPKYDSRDRGYYSCAFATRYGGHLIQGGKDFLVKGINKEGKERYFAHSSVDNFTDYYKRIA